MKTPFILTVAAAAILAVGCDRQKQTLNERSIDSEKNNIQKTAREAKSEVDKKAQAQKGMLDAETKAAVAKLDAEKARLKAESTPDAQSKVDAAAQNIRDAAGTVGAKVQTEIGAERNPAAPTATSASNDSVQKLIDQVRIAAFGTAEANADNSQAIQVSAHGGAITLKGSVKSQEEKTRIETAAKAVSGVSKVENQLEVKAE